MNQKISILLVEDDDRIRSFMEAVLTTNGYNILETTNARTALSMAASHNPDLMLLDLGLPDMDGQQVIRSIREWSRMPIVVVSARGQEKDKVSALDSGADDYVTKPFGTAELLARIRAALRNSVLRASGGVTADAVFQFHGLVVDTDKRLVKVDDTPIHLTQIEYKIVALLARNAGKVLPTTSSSKRSGARMPAVIRSCCASTWPISAESSKRTPPCRNTLPPKSASVTAWWAINPPRNSRTPCTGSWPAQGVSLYFTVGRFRIFLISASNPPLSR